MDSLEAEPVVAGICWAVPRLLVLVWFCAFCHRSCPEHLLSTLSAEDTRLLFKAGSDTALFAPNCGSSSGVEETWVSTISTEIDPHFPKMLQRCKEITQKAAEAIVTRKLNRCSQQVYIAVQKQSP